jgi:hypothetical protein
MSAITHTPASFHSPAQHTKTKQPHNVRACKKSHALHCFFAIFRSKCLTADAEEQEQITPVKSVLVCPVQWIYCLGQRQVPAT